MHIIVKLVNIYEINRNIFIDNDGELVTFKYVFLYPTLILFHNIITF